MSKRVDTTKAFYRAFAWGDREFVERHMTEDFRFSAPPDPRLDRAGYFERCWPWAGKGQIFEFIRTLEVGDEVVVTYETDAGDGKKGRNTEILHFTGDKIDRAEVYFGWTLET